MGSLYIVATPIGNLGDFSPRAREVLKAVDLIACEDTRHSRKLLDQFGIATPCQSCHEHNEGRVTQKLLERIQSGADVALISDAGTPLISDPGFLLVREAHQLGVNIVSIPGPCALIAVLACAGLPTDRFVFEGFLPAKKAARRNRLVGLVAEERTLVLYESSHRIEGFMDDLLDLFGPDRMIGLGREVTKRFEVIRHDRLVAMREWIRVDANHRRGEFVVCIHGAKPVADVIDSGASRTLKLLSESLPDGQAVKLASRLTGISRNRLYDYLMEYKRRQE